MTAILRNDPKITPLQGGQRYLFLLGLLLLWPGLVNGDVYGFNDTVSYLRGADTVFAKLTGEHAAFFAPSSAAEPAAVPASRGDTMVLYGRSLYFGVFLYIGLLLGSLWVPVVLQALAAGAMIVGAVRQFVDPSDSAKFRRACFVAFALLVCTPLPFFVCFLMPDLAVSLAFLAAALLLCGWPRERPAWRWGYMIVLIFAALAHSTAVAVLLVLGLGGLGVAVAVRSRATALAAAGVLVAALTGIGGEAAFGLATRLATGTEPVRPPFLTARLIEGGPARRFLDERCGKADFVLCRHPIVGDVNAQMFLWDTSRPTGGFKALPRADAIGVSREQTRFALAVLRAYPGETVAALAKDFVTLVGTLGLDDFRPEYLGARMHAERLYEAMPPGKPLPLMVRAVTAFTWVALLASLAILVWFGRSRRKEMRVVLVVTAAIVLNAMICAWLSGPFARYHTRVVWALPLVAALLVLSRRTRPSRVTSPDKRQAIMSGA